MKYFAASYGDAIKVDEKENEDFYLASKKYPIFAVADGVTRSHFKDGRYAFPQGAKMASQFFCKSVVDFLEENFSKNGDPKNKIKQAFDFANKQIKELNKKNSIDKKINYIEYDWFDAVGVAGIIFQNIIYFGYVGDCGLVIFDKDNEKIFQTKDMVLPPVLRFRDTFKKWASFPINKRKYLIRTKLRNNPDGSGYGSFSGEEGVKKYYVFGQKKLEAQDMAVFYSDGFVKYLENKKFIDILRNESKKELNKFMFWKIIANLFKYGNDRTFISIIFNKN